MPDAYQTAHLDLHDSGTVYLRCLPNAYLFDTVGLGHVGMPVWPPELGQPPDWLDVELDDCRVWHDAVEWGWYDHQMSDRRVVLNLCHRT